MRRVLIFVLVVACTAPRDPGAPAEVDVCAVWTNPTSYLQRDVTFETRVESDGRHLSLLMGKACQRGLRYTYSESVPQATQEALTKAIFSPWPSTRGKNIQARFTGRLHHAPGETRYFPYYLELSKVENLSVEIGKRPW